MQPGQQFILIDQANGRQQIVQMPTEMSGQVQQAQSVPQTRIIQQNPETQQQPAKKVRRIEHQENNTMRGNFLWKWLTRYVYFVPISYLWGPRLAVIFQGLRFYKIYIITLVLKSSNDNTKSNPVFTEIGKYSAEDFKMCTTKVSRYKLETPKENMIRFPKAFQHFF